MTAITKNNFPALYKAMATIDAALDQDATEPRTSFQVKGNWNARVGMVESALSEMSDEKFANVCAARGSARVFVVDFFNAFANGWESV